MGLDSVILTGIISITCGNLGEEQGSRQGCSKGIEAASIQSGIYENLKIQEKKITKNMEDELKKNLNKSTIEAMSTSLLLGRLLLSYNTVFRLGKGLLGETYTLETDTKNTKIRMSIEL